MSKRVVQYLRLCAKELIDDHDQNRQWRLIELRERVWDRMTREEREQANEFVQRIFGKWY